MEACSENAVHQHLCAHYSTLDESHALFLGVEQVIERISAVLLIGSVCASGLYGHIVQLRSLYRRFNIAAAEALYKGYPVTGQDAEHLLREGSFRQSAYVDNSYPVALVEQYIRSRIAVAAVVARTCKEYHRGVLGTELRFIAAVAVYKLRKLPACVFHELPL